MKHLFDIKFIKPLIKQIWSLNMEPNTMQAAC